MGKREGGRKGEESQHPGPGQAAECRVERLFPHSLPQKRAEAQLKEAAAAANSRKGTRNGGRAMQLYGKNITRKMKSDICDSSKKKRT